MQRLGVAAGCALSVMSRQNAPTRPDPAITTIATQQQMAPDKLPFGGDRTMIEIVIVILAVAALIVSLVTLREALDIGNDLVEVKAMLQKREQEWG